MAETEELKIQEIWLNNKDAAEFLNISTKTLKRYRDLGYFPCSKCLRKVMFKKSDLIAHLNKHYK